MARAMARIATLVIGLGLIMTLSACAGGMDGPPAVTDEARVATARINAEAAIAKADWPRALTRTLRIRQGVYHPLVISLRKGIPFILRLENGDDTSRSFRAPSFFQAIAIKSLTPSDREINPTMALDSITVEPRQTLDLAFVPMRDGSFPFTDGWTALLLGGTFGNRGVITIN